MDILDEDIAASILEDMKELGIQVYLKTDIKSFDYCSTAEASIKVTLTNNLEIPCSALLDNSTFEGGTDDLDLPAAGVDVDDFGFVTINKDFCTNIPHIYAMGESVKAPLLGTDSMDQGRRAIGKMFGLKDVEQLSENWPIQIQLSSPVAIYGETEKSLKAREVKCVIGVGHFAECPKGEFLRVRKGYLKLIVRKDTEEIVGVKIIGKNARELIHFGMELCQDQVTVTKIIGSVFNEYTFHEVYKIAALDALYKLCGKG